MVEHAREALDPERATVFQADLTELVLDEPVDAVFSNAVFHWIGDHDALFARLHAALRPGGRLVAQCGERERGALPRGRAGGCRPRSLRALSRGLGGSVELRGRSRPPRGLEAAGFTEVETWLSPTPSRRPIRSPSPAPYASVRTSSSCQMSCANRTLTRFVSALARLGLRSLNICAVSRPSERLGVDFVSPPGEMDAWQGCLSAFSLRTTRSFWRPEEPPHWVR